MLYYVTVGERTVEVDLSGSEPTVDGTAVSTELVALPGTPIRHLLIDGCSYPLIARAEPRRGRWTIGIGGRSFSAEAVDERTRAIHEMTGAGAAEAEKLVAAPMPGLVLRVDVEIGQQVRAGQGVVVIEAMKMENELRAPADGTVIKVAVGAGQTVEKGATLLVLD